METQYHVGFTGTQEGATRYQLRHLARYFRIILYQHPLVQCVLHHGDCIGADEDAHRIAKRMQFKMILHPPVDNAKRAFCRLRDGDEAREEFPYLIRNQHIVDESVHLFACPKTTKEQLRSGTWATVRYARKLNVPVKIIPPNPRR